MAFLSILGAFEDIMVNCFVHVGAYWAVRGVGLVDSMEVMIQGDVSSPELDVHAGVSFG